MGEGLFRKCQKCGEIRPLFMFSFKDRATGKRVSHCKPCVNKHGKLIYAKRGKTRVARTDTTWGQKRILFKSEDQWECGACGELKHPSQFHQASTTTCKACANERAGYWYIKNKVRANEQSKKWKLSHKERSWASGVLGRHRKSGYTVNVSIDEVVDMIRNTTVCPICGRILSYRDKAANTDRAGWASIDRIDNGNSLDLNNIMILCLGCNSTKGARTMSEFKEYCQMAAKRIKEIGY